MLNDRELSDSVRTFHMSANKGLVLTSGLGPSQLTKCIWFVVSKPLILDMGCVAGTYEVYSWSFWLSRDSAAMLAPLMLTAPLNTLNRKHPISATVVCLLILIVNSDLVSNKMFRGSFRQLQSFTFCLMNGSSSDPKSSDSCGRLDGGMIEASGTGSLVISGVTMPFAFASALSLAAATALNGFVVARIVIRKCFAQTCLRHPYQLAEGLESRPQPFFSWTFWRFRDIREHRLTFSRGSLASRIEFSVSCSCGRRSMFAGKKVATASTLWAHWTCSHAHDEGSKENPRAPAGVEDEGKGPKHALEGIIEQRTCW